MSQCTYRCVVLPDKWHFITIRWRCSSLNAPTGAWCSLTREREALCITGNGRLNAPTGAWCSLTVRLRGTGVWCPLSQCTYRCVVLPDIASIYEMVTIVAVSMHLQVRGAP